MEEGMKWNKEKEGLRLKGLAEFLGTKEEEFDDLWTKLERREKSVIGGFVWHFEFC